MWVASEVRAAMVFFALTRAGCDEFLRLDGASPGSALWVNKDVLSSAELARLRASGASVTNFTRVIDICDSVSVDEAVATIKEHHPHEVVWVER